MSRFARLFRWANLSDVAPAESGPAETLCISALRLFVTASEAGNPVWIAAVLSTAQ
jgi:hypothetical protein